MPTFADLIRQPLLVAELSTVGGTSLDVGPGPCVVYAVTLASSRIEKALVYNALTITGENYVFLTGNIAWADASRLASKIDFAPEGVLFDVGVSLKLDSTVVGAGGRLAVYYKLP